MSSTLYGYTTTATGSVIDYLQYTTASNTSVSSGTTTYIISDYEVIAEQKRQKEEVLNKKVHKMIRNLLQ